MLGANQQVSKAPRSIRRSRLQLWLRWLHLAGQPAKKWPQAHIYYKVFIGVYRYLLRCSHKTVAPVSSAVCLIHINTENRHKTGNDDDNKSILVKIRLRQKSGLVATLVSYFWRFFDVQGGGRFICGSTYTRDYMVREFSRKIGLAPCEENCVVH